MAHLGIPGVWARGRPVLGVSGALPTPKDFCYPFEPAELDRSHGNNTLVTTAR